MIHFHDIEYAERAHDNYCITAANEVLAEAGMAL